MSALDHLALAFSAATASKGGIEAFTSCLGCWGSATDAPKVDCAVCALEAVLAVPIARWRTTNKLGEDGRQHCFSYCEPCWHLLLSARTPGAKPLTGLVPLGKAGQPLIEAYEASVATAAAAAAKKTPSRKPTSKPKAPKKVTPKAPRRRSAVA